MEPMNVIHRKEIESMKHIQTDIQELKFILKVCATEWMWGTVSDLEARHAVIYHETKHFLKIGKAMSNQPNNC